MSGKFWPFRFTVLPFFIVHEQRSLQFSLYTCACTKEGEKVSECERGAKEGRERYIYLRAILDENL